LCVYRGTSVLFCIDQHSEVGSDAAELIRCCDDLNVCELKYVLLYGNAVKRDVVVPNWLVYGDILIQSLVHDCIEYCNRDSYETEVSDEYSISSGIVLAVHEFGDVVLQRDSDDRVAKHSHQNA